MYNQLFAMHINNFVMLCWSKAKTHRYENWESPEIGRDTPGVSTNKMIIISGDLMHATWKTFTQVLEGRSAPCWIADKPPSMDNDSAYQEPDLVTIKLAKDSDIQPDLVQD